MSKIHSALALVLSVVLAQSAGLLGSLATRPQIASWYRTLEKPVFTPPDWAFPVVWPTLFLLMAIAAWLVYRQQGPKGASFWSGGASYEGMFLRRSPSRALALGMYLAQLVLNTLWSFLFFAMEHPGLALFEIVLLLVFIVFTTLLFYRIRPLAGYLMIPYVIWVSYATILNAAIWWLN